MVEDDPDDEDDPEDEVEPEPADEKAEELIVDPEPDEELVLEPEEEPSSAAVSSCDCCIADSIAVNSAVRDACSLAIFV